MSKTIGVVVLALTLAMGGSTVLGGTALASSAGGEVAPTTSCVYTVYFWGYKWVIPAPCPANAANGSSATSSSGASSAGSNGSSP
jgi:hypothetical protein